MYEDVCMHVPVFLNIEGYTNAFFAQRLVGPLDN
jgi:hypothetical protein